jgi:hypothetical protein
VQGVLIIRLIRKNIKIKLYLPFERRLTAMKTTETRQEAASEMIVDQGRRSAMRKIAISVGVLAGVSVLPEHWTRPIIGQIVVPAHAGTSGVSLFDPCSVAITSGDFFSGNVTVQVNGYVTPPTANLVVTITAEAVGGAGLSTGGTVTTNGSGNFTATLSVGGGGGITAVNVTTSVAGASGVANCTAYTGASSSPPA